MYYFNFDWDHFSMLLVRGPLKKKVYYSWSSDFLGHFNPKKNILGVNYAYLSVQYTQKY